MSKTKEMQEEVRNEQIGMKEAAAEKKYKNHKQVVKAYEKGELGDKNYFVIDRDMDIVTLTASKSTKKNPYGKGEPASLYQAKISDFLEDLMKMHKMKFRVIGG
jgi:predicted phage gp36 major capsid-like protein